MLGAFRVLEGQSNLRNINADDGKGELYHLANDPMEMNNLAAQKSEKAQQMVQQMTKLLEEVSYQTVLSNPEYSPR